MYEKPIADKRRVESGKRIVIDRRVAAEVFFYEFAVLIEGSRQGTDHNALGQLGN